MNLSESPFQVVFEDNHLLIVNKAAGVPVQADKTGDICLIDHCKAYLKEKYGKSGEVFMGLVHRLDRPVSGLVVMARTSKALERMNKIFHDRQVQKVYRAIVKGTPENHSGTLEHWLVKNAHKNMTTAFATEKKGSKIAQLSYRLLAEGQRHALLEVLPHTGRSHQIRVQLATMDCPIKGDVKYGYPSANRDKSICLHAYSLEFEHPVKKEPIKVHCLPTHLEGWKWFDMENTSV
jgi:23S rRNA pseudouridine1911/1915/1917 synthase